MSAYLDKRIKEVELHGLRAERYEEYEHGIPYSKERLYCKFCSAELSTIVYNCNGEYEVNFCTECGTDLRIETL